MILALFVGRLLGISLKPASGSISALSDEQSHLRFVRQCAPQPLPRELADEPHANHTCRLRPHDALVIVMTDVVGKVVTCCPCLIHPVSAKLIDPLAENAGDMLGSRQGFAFAKLQGVCALTRPARVAESGQWADACRWIRISPGDLRGRYLTQSSGW